MYGASITITRDNATPFMRQLMASIQPAKVIPIAGRAGRNLLREHLFKLADDRHRGIRGTGNFYGSAARSTQFDQDGNDVVLSINHTGIAQRYFGGRITPVNSKWLTIPANDEAAGKRAGEFTNLEAVFNSAANFYALVERQADTISFRKTKKGVRVKTTGQSGGRIMFWLRKSVFQQPDPTVLPDTRTLLGAVMNELNIYVLRSMNG